MSWGTCYSGSNNIHFDYPPIMNDGRNFATWVPANEVSENIRTKENIQNNNDYRQYLVNNADNIIVEITRLQLVISVATVRLQMLDRQ